MSTDILTLHRRYVYHDIRRPAGLLMGFSVVPYRFISLVFGVGLDPFSSRVTDRTGLTLGKGFSSWKERAKREGSILDFGAWPINTYRETKDGSRCTGA